MNSIDPIPIEDGNSQKIAIEMENLGLQVPVEEKEKSVDQKIN